MEKDHPELNHWTSDYYIHTISISDSSFLKGFTTTDNMATIQLIAEDIMQDLTECSICLSLIDEPKALPCLHTFCLKCIEDWAKEQDKDRIICPICQESSPIPPDGVHSLKTNFFITKLKETRMVQEQLKEAKVPCTCCDEDGANAVSRCLECKDFLCVKCVEMHKTLRPLKGHRLCNLDELRSGKISLSATIQEYCDKHKGQVLWFYCSTCKEPICRDCTVIDHPATCHLFTDLETTSKTQKGEIEKLASECQKVSAEIDFCIKQADDSGEDLEKALAEAVVDLEHFLKLTKTKLLANLDESHSDLTDELSQLCDERRKQVVTQKQSLILQQSRLRTALETANRVTQMGSQCDVASVHGTLVPNMQQLSALAPKPIPNNLSKIRFRPNKTCCPKVLSLGSFSLGPGKEGGGTWSLDKTLGTDGPGMLSTALDIAVTPCGDFAVADNNTAKVRVYTKFGQYKFSLDTKQGLKSGQSTYPRGVAVSTDGNFFVTDGTQYVKVYDTHGRYVYHFAAISPNGTPSDLVAARLAGLTMDVKGHILVGEITQKYISKHDPNSRHMTSFKVNIDPNFISVATHGEIVLSSCDQNTVQILDDSGNLLHSLQPPSGVTTWYPTGLCCSPDDEIFVAKQATGNAAIYRYGLSGEYLGCVTQEVDNPCGLVLADEDKLLVADWKAVLVFRLK